MVEPEHWSERAILSTLAQSDSRFSNSLSPSVAGIRTGRTSVRLLGHIALSNLDSWLATIPFTASKEDGVYPWVVALVPLLGIPMEPHQSNWLNH